MLAMARPEGSFIFWKDASHANAVGVLHAIKGKEGTVSAAARDGKWSSKMLR